MRAALASVTATFNNARTAEDTPFAVELTAAKKACKVFELVERINELSGNVEPLNEDELAAHEQIEKDHSALLREAGGQEAVTLETLAAGIKGLGADIATFRTENKQDFKGIDERFDGMEKKLEEASWRMKSLEARSLNSVASYASAGYRLESVPSSTTGEAFPEGITEALDSDARVLGLSKNTATAWLGLYGIEVASTVSSAERRAKLLRFLCLK